MKTNVHKHNTDQKKPDTEESMLCDSFMHYSKNRRDESMEVLPFEQRGGVLTGKQPEEDPGVLVYAIFWT